jgi:hypothetical protein
MRQAATVLLLREQQDDLEVLMMRRGAALSFMAGMWVFPGGRMEPADQSPEALERIPPTAVAACGERLHSMQGERLADADAIALHVAACRNFEEAGVLLARDRRGRPARRPTSAAAAASCEIEQEAGRFIALLERRTSTSTSGRSCTGHTGLRRRSNRSAMTPAFGDPVPPDQP